MQSSTDYAIKIRTFPEHTIRNLPNINAISPPVLVPQMRSKISYGNGAGFNPSLSASRFITFFKMSKEDRPRTPPPSRLKMQSARSAAKAAVGELPVDAGSTVIQSPCELPCKTSDVKLRRLVVFNAKFDADSTWRTERLVKQLGATNTGRTRAHGFTPRNHIGFVDCGKGIAHSVLTNSRQRISLFALSPRGQLVKRQR